MAETMTRGQVQDLLSKFAIANPKYRQALIKDPKALIEKQLNASLGPTNGQGRRRHGRHRARRDSVRGRRG